MTLKGPGILATSSPPAILQDHARRRRTWRSPPMWVLLFNVGIGRGRPSRGGRSRCATRAPGSHRSADQQPSCSDAGPTPLVCVWRANWVSGRSRRAPEVQPARCAVPGAWPRGRRMPRPSRSAPDARRHDRTPRWPRVVPVLAPSTEPSRAPDRAPAEARPPPKRLPPALAPAQGRTLTGLKECSPWR